MSEGYRAFTRHIVLGILLRIESLFREKTATCVYSAIRYPTRYASPIVATRTIDRITSHHPHRFGLHSGDSCIRDRSVRGQKNIESPATQSAYLVLSMSLQRMNLCRCRVEPQKNPFIFTVAEDSEV